MRRAGIFRHGAKVLLLPGANGKIDPAAIGAAVRSSGRTCIIPKPRAVSITQATEGGTVYSVEEVRAVSEARGNAGWRCTWMARGSPTPWPRWT